MDDAIRSDRAPDSRPLWLVPQSALESWRAGLPAELGNWVRNARFEAEARQLLLLPGRDGGVAGAAVGLGAVSEPTLWTASALPGRLPGGHWHLAKEPTAEVATRVLLGWALGGYRFDAYRSKPPARAARPTLQAPAAADLDWVRRAAAGDALARDLVNTPAGDMGPEQLAAAALQVAGRRGGHCEEVTGEALLGAGLRMIHAVGRAGSQAPRLIDLRWGDESHPKVTLVGKGVCFDTGGLDLKNAQSMLLMKKDMGGAACVLGLADMLMDARLPIRLRVLIPAVENNVDAVSYRPGDVLRSHKGMTVEIGNTDAEGRLVLADALALAGEESPDLLLDMATLTGAARVALGPDLPAMYSNDDTLAGEIEAAALAQSDPVWRMPLWEPYDEDLASKVADLSNVASNGGFAGSIVAALFLQRFVSSGTRWAHVDLYAWNPRERPGRPVGAQAQCIRALYGMLARRYPRAAS